MGCTPEPTGDPEHTSTVPVRRPEQSGALPAGSFAGEDVPVRRHRVLRSLARTGSHGLVHGLASAAGGAVVTGFVRWNQR